MSVTGPILPAGTVEFDRFSDVFFNDPFNTYRRLRDEAPVYHNEKYGFLGAVALRGRRAGVEGLRNLLVGTGSSTALSSRPAWPATNAASTISSARRAGRLLNSAARRSRSTAERAAPRRMVRPAACAIRSVTV
jgi:hypothetical protein